MEKNKNNEQPIPSNRWLESAGLITLIVLGLLVLFGYFLVVQYRKQLVSKASELPTSQENAKLIAPQTKHQQKIIRITKTSLASEYGVSKKTFNKWLSCFAPLLAKRLRSHRQLSLKECSKTYEYLGEANPEKSLSKRQLIQICESNLKTLRENVISNPKQYGFKDAQQYDSLEKLPPKICSHIIHIFG